MSDGISDEAVPEAELIASKVEAFVQQQQLSTAATEVLKLVMQDASITVIAQRLQISPDAVRKRLSELYSKFAIEGKGPGKLKHLREKLRTTPSQSTAQFKTHYDWGEAPQMEPFLGRAQDVAQVDSWLTNSSCNLVVLVGMGGIGKTALSVAVAKQLVGQFERIVWRTVPANGQLDALLHSLLPDPPPTPPSGLSSIDCLVQWLATHRDLLILDGYDAVFRNQPSQEIKNRSRQRQAGLYPKDRGDFRNLLMRLGQTQLKGCMLITSREKPQELLTLAGPKLPVKTYTVPPLTEADARQVLHDAWYLDASDRETKVLNERYAGNPLGLKIAADTIKNVFSDSVSQFLRQSFLVIDDFRNALKQQFNRTNLLEREALYWLAINRKPVQFSVLQKDIVALSNQEDLLYTLRSLEHRSLIDIQPHGQTFTLKPTVMEYVTQRFVKQVRRDLGLLSENSKEISGEQIEEGAEAIENQTDLLNTHALLKAGASDYIRASQQRYIVQPLKDALIQEKGGLRAAKAHVNDLLQDCCNQQSDRTQNIYRVGNLLNLLTQFSQDLKEDIFSEQTTLTELTIRQAYLADVDLSKTRFDKCRLDESVFRENLGDVITVGFGKASALDDIDELNESEWLTDDDDLEELGFLAVGDANGRIHLWNAATFKKHTYWPAHTSWVRSVAFSPNGQWLISGGDDKALRLWQMPMNAFQRVAAPQPIRQIPATDLQRATGDRLPTV
ncbi:MAG: NB-ARC domain-containing protein, partial [Cyanobacteria bacterium P01_A01_bin.17]